MALLPYLMDLEIRPRRRLRDHFFGIDLPHDDFLSDLFNRPAVQRKYLRPWRNALKDEGSTLKADKDKFQINVDVQHFAPDEISVKTADGFVIIEGNHEEKEDDHGFISRTFKRRYALPKDCNPETVESKLSSDGVLTVICPKSSGAKGERAIPITHTGPVRREAEDKPEGKEENGHEPVEEKSPQKKRRKN